jgi:hypothetical protein
LIINDLSFCPSALCHLLCHLGDSRRLLALLACATLGVG